MTSADWVAIGVAALAALVSAGTAIFTARTNMRNKRLEVELSEESRLRERVERYQEPLVLAAEQLRSRLWNVRKGKFFTRYLVGGSETEREYAHDSTLWLIARYFCWVEVLEREVQFLRFQGADQTRSLQRHIADVSATFASDSITDLRFRVFRVQQKAIGEIMMTTSRDREGGERTDCLGFAEFSTRVLRPEISLWLVELSNDVGAQRRNSSLLRLEQTELALGRLVKFVDSEEIRFSHSRDDDRRSLSLQD